MEKSELRTQLFESFADVPLAWGGLCEPDDLAMNLAALSVFEHALKPDFRCWGLIVYDLTGQAIGCAALCAASTEIIESQHPFIINARDKFRALWPKFARIGVLFCGLPIPSGSNHIRIRSGADSDDVVREIEQAMGRLADKNKCRLMVFKEFDNNATSLAKTLDALGYSRGGIPPMHHLESHFTSFAEYRDCLKSRYRAQVLRSQKKCLIGGFKILAGRGKEFFAMHFNDDVHRLYIEVQKRAEHKLELLPFKFFTEMAKALDKEVLLTVILRDDRVCAFTFSVLRGSVHYNLYSGLDYELNNEGDLYFNLFYADMDAAFKSGATSLHLGQTSDSFKSRLGSHTQNLSFFVRARSDWFNRILQRFSKLAFPKVSLVESNDVFTKAG